MPNPLFSTYRGGENRVTSSTLAVFERLSLDLVKYLLQNATDVGEDLQAVVFENQVAGAGSVPDARISARFTWWFETKTDLVLVLLITHVLPRQFCDRPYQLSEPVGSGHG